MGAAALTARIGLPTRAARCLRWRAGSRSTSPAGRWSPSAGWSAARAPRRSRSASPSKPPTRAPRPSCSPSPTHAAAASPCSPATPPASRSPRSPPRSPQGRHHSARSSSSNPACDWSPPRPAATASRSPSTCERSCPTRKPRTAWWSSTAGRRGRAPTRSWPGPPICSGPSRPPRPRSTAQTLLADDALPAPGRWREALLAITTERRPSASVRALRRLAAHRCERLALIPHSAAIARGEQAFHGGRQTVGITRIGDTPARTSCTPSCATSRPRASIAPRACWASTSTDAEVLTYIDGKTIDSSPVSLSDGRPVSAAQLIRRFHETTAGTALVQTGRREPSPISALNCRCRRAVEASGRWSLPYAASAWRGGQPALGVV